MSTFYEILNIDKTASKDEIKRSFRKLAVKYHPDKNPGNLHAEEKFKQINQAYQILKDPIKRRAYDQRLQYLEFMIRNRTAQKTGTTRPSGAAYTRNPYQAPTHQTTYTSTYTSYNPRQRRSTRTGPAQQRSTQKEDKIFITQLGIFIAIFFAIAIYAYVNTQNEFTAQEERMESLDYKGSKELLKEVRKHVKNEDYRDAYNVLGELNFDFPRSIDRDKAEELLAYTLRENARNAINNQKYDEAIKHLSLLREFRLIRESGLKVEEFNKLFYKTAFNNNHEQEAKEALLQVAQDSIDLYKAYAVIGQSYINKEQYDSAYGYLVKSVSIIVTNNYVKRYGEVYYMLDMFRIPDIHYEIFCNKAIAEINLNKIDEAERTLNFIENNKPSEARAFHIHATFEKKLNNLELSCLLYKKAQEKDSLLIDESLSAYCL